MCIISNTRRIGTHIDRVLYTSFRKILSKASFIFHIFTDQHINERIIRPGTCHYSYVYVEKYSNVEFILIAE